MCGADPGRKGLPSGGRRAVFLDRDGVLNEGLVRGNKAYAPLSLGEFQLVDGAGEQIQRLRAAGFVCIVVTNQPEVARGTLDPTTLEQMHNMLRASVAVDDIYVCLHDPADGCDCHKPKPGMLQAAATRWRLDLRESFVVGDRWRDIEAGAGAGCYTILLERPYSACTTADARVGTLAEAVDVILARAERRWG